MVILTFIGGYLLIGCVFGFGFFLRGYCVIAPEAEGAPLVVRLMWTPAAIALWPLLAWKWLRNRNRDRNQSQNQSQN